MCSDPPKEQYLPSHLPNLPEKMERQDQYHRLFPASTRTPRRELNHAQAGHSGYLSHKVLAAADSMVESLDQQGLHMLKNQPSTCVEWYTAVLRLWGRLSLGRIHLSWGTGM